jgi:hypothetical protein
MIQVMSCRTNNPYSQKTVETIFSTIRDSVSFAKMVNGEGQTIIRFFRKFIDIKYQAKFR